MADNSGETLAYDLRQRYAEMVAEHLIDIAIKRKAKNYPAWFNALEDLECVINHKFKVSKKESKNDEEGYLKLKKIAIEKANKYNMAFLGRTHAPQHLFEIQESLRNIEKFLYKVMDSAKMFGSSWDGGGL
jgi:hypothetical protein